MRTKLTVELNDQQAIGLIAMAADKSWTVEDEVLHLIEAALAESGHLPAVSLEDFLKDVPEPVGKPAKPPSRE
jgi:hypothetical protein